MRFLAALARGALLLALARTVAAAPLVARELPPVISLSLASLHGLVQREDGSMVSYCPAGTSDAASCPMPTATALDHHDGALAVTTSVYLVDEDGHFRAPSSTTTLSYAKRAEYLLKYDAADASGNQAEQLSFTMIFNDEVAPVLSVPWADEVQDGLESCSHASQSAARCQWLVPHSASAIDNIDGDLSQEMRVTISPPGSDGGSTFTQAAHAQVAIDTRVLGKWRVTYQVTDHAGKYGTDQLSNTVTTTREVWVRDTRAPRTFCKPLAAPPAQVGSLPSHAALPPAQQPPADVNTFDACAAACFRQQYGSTGALASLVSHGYSPEVMPLQRCHGDCDHDGHCSAGFTCHHNDAKDAIPGCQGVSEEGMDYCVGAPGCNWYARSRSGACTLYHGALHPSLAIGDDAVAAADEIGSLTQCDAPNQLQCGSGAGGGGQLAFKDPGALCIDDRDSYDINGDIELASVAPNVTATPPLDTKSAGVYHISYACTDRSGNHAPPVTRTVDVLDTLGPDLQLLGSQHLQLTCGDPDNNATQQQLLAAGHGFTCSDQCDGALDGVVSDAYGAGIAIYAEDCDGTYACIGTDPSQDASCHGGSRSPVSTDSLLTAGTWAIKYVCADKSGNSIARCRKVTVLPSPVCNPDLGARQPSVPVPTTVPPSPAPTPVPQDCEVAPWSTWSACSSDCGEGLQQRSRALVLPASGGAACPALDEVRDCNMQACPVHCASAYMGWTACSQSCGGGHQKAEVEVHAAPENGGQSCPMAKQRVCNSQPCPRDCLVTSWGTWQACSVECGGGHRQRNRVLVSGAQFGGQVCPALSAADACNAHACPIDCALSDWGDWGGCSQPCGVGVQTRHRDITTEPLGTSMCDTLVNAQDCNVHECPVHCEYTWESWSICTRSCGSGMRYRGLYVSKPSSAGGDPCPTVEEEVCNDGACPVDCIVEPWGSWTSCSATCDTGSMARSRTVAHVAAAGGKRCPSLQQAQVCATSACPVNCEVATWGSWSQCTEPCGGGVRSRSRLISVTPQHGGTPCPALREEDSCNPRGCPVDCVFTLEAWQPCTVSCGSGVETRAVTVHVAAEHDGKACPLSEERVCNQHHCPLDCLLSSWADWSPCSKTCGKGMRQRQRMLQVPALFGGKLCGILFETSACADYSCPSNCAMETWGAWGACTQECGVGVSLRTRRIIVPAAHGGIPCGAAGELRNCNTSPCPVDCSYIWEPWSPCSRSCGSGSQTRGHYLVHEAKHGGQPCPIAEDQVCNAQSCPADCIVSSWLSWSTCTRTCGIGTQERTRKVFAVPRLGGKVCPSLSEVQNCNAEPCPVACTVHAWGTWYPCDRSCGSGQRVRQRSIKASAQHGGTACPTTWDFQACHVHPCPIDCVLNAWGSWEACSLSCGGGAHMRFRSQVVTAAYGGKPCAALATRQACNSNDCPRDCSVSVWSEWSSCSNSCGAGVQSRSRSTMHAASGGGKPCPDLREQLPCSNGPCPLHCQVSEFTSWSPCTVSCGSGHQTRTRSISAHATNGGYTCPTLNESRVCQSDMCPMDCKVSAFGDWSSCTHSCGGGTKYRQRNLQMPAIAGGKGCPQLWEVATCGVHPCAINCVMAQWGAWGSCSTTCGGGARLRHRSIEQSSSFAGTPCPETQDVQTCVNAPCPSACVVSSWGSWNACPASCGTAQQQRYRSVNAEPQFGGAACPVLSSVQYCNTHACPVDCKASVWTDWSVCSATCGNGMQFRYRTITQVPNFGGMQCGASYEQQACFNGGCDLTCKVSGFSPWSACTKSCGSGKQARHRTVIAGSGTDCPALVQTSDCNTSPCPVPCQVSEWSEWSACSRDCGTGTQARNRHMTAMNMFGGSPCSTFVEVRTCNAHSCAIDCSVSMWGQWSPCSKTCGSGVNQRFRAVTVQASATGQACPAVSETRHCATEFCPVDCQLTLWSMWSECSQPCASGLQQRARSVIVPQAHGGAICAPLSEQKECNAQACPVDCHYQLQGWTTCTRTCGTGVQKNPTIELAGAQNGGAECPATLERTCNVQTCPKDCVVSTLGPWSACTQSCASGIQGRHRAVQVPASAQGVPCPPLTETRSCNTNECPVDCEVGDWTAWNNGATACSRSCGSGWRTRHRVSVHPQFGGRACPHAAEMEECNTHACPIDCKMMAWADWTECSASCGSGVQSRWRGALQSGAFGGQSCAHATEQRACSAAPCAIDCIVSAWSAFSPCSVTCGTGMRLRTRVIVKHSGHGGMVCPSLRGEEPCFLGACSTHCEMSSFSAWSACSRSCGSGVQTRARSVVKAPSGSTCPYLTQARSCNETPCAVDCTVSSFSAWTECTLPCGLGRQTRRRGIVAVSEHGGKPCPMLTAWQSCNAHPCAVDCVVSSWGGWHSCTVSCGGGTLARVRSISRGAAFGGSACPAIEDIASCADNPCPVDCMLSSWASWAECSTSCGGVHAVGWRTRRRVVMRPVAHGGQFCGSTTEALACNRHACPTDCVLSAWSEWGACSTTCGGGITQRQRAPTVHAANGGRPCDALIENGLCNPEECPVHCVVSEATAWSACSQSCGFGVQKRARSVIQHASTGGYQCPALEQTRACNDHPCPADCVVSSLSAWDTCTVSCGSGVQFRHRAVLAAAQYGGRSCPHTQESRTCAAQACPTDCVVSTWGAWDVCGTTCGGGEKSRYRTVTVDASIGGAVCPALSESSPCHTHMCPIDCQMSGWSAWGACSQPCGGGIKSKSRSVTTPASNGGQPCNGLFETVNCNAEACAPVDCMYTVQSWTPCSKSCGGGTQTRPISITSVGVNGGLGCPDAEDRMCNTAPCPVDCAMGNWGEWAACSRSCGNGYRYRTAQPMRWPSYGGKQCQHFFQQESCSTAPCPADCTITSWASWSQCDRACGSGAQVRARAIAQSPLFGGRSCPLLSQSRACNTEECAIDCLVSEFGQWGMCSRSCGTGRQTRARLIQRQAAYGGLPCPLMVEHRPCNAYACPVDCVEGSWGTWSACSASCNDGERWRHRSIEREPVLGGRSCGPQQATVSCSTSACPVDCAVSPWTAWSDCSSTCGSGGTHLRMRTVVEQTKNGGAVCPPLHEQSPCSDGPCPAHCEVSAFAAWSACTATCGSGTQRRVRSIVTQAALGGHVCPTLHEVRVCSAAMCPMDCRMSSFSAWSTCSGHCGGGVQLRTRSLLSPALMGGKGCPAFFELRSCGMQPCAINCVMTQWGAYGTCSTTCGGGMRSRLRSVNVSPSFDGSPCGALEETSGCSVATCPVDCAMSAWGQWNPCPVTCGGGLQHKHRSVSRPTAHGGSACSRSAESRECNSYACPSDCSMTAWTEWSECSNSCGSGVHSRSRSIVRTASAGGASCGVLSQEQLCTNGVCPVHCQVSSFAAWSFCSKSCGTGTQSQTRSVVTKESNGGYTCPVLGRTRACNEQACAVDCTVSSFGDWGACSHTCGAGIQHRQRNIVVPQLSGGKGCPPLLEQRQCNMHSCPTDCVVSSWSNWHMCSRSCGSGQRVRFRNRVVVAENGGRACPDVVETSACNDHMCPSDAELSDWGSWTACSATCGHGEQARARSVVKPAAHGGKIPGHTTERRGCGANECPIDCVMANWGAWGVCTASCGAGQQNRYRGEDVPSAFGGKACEAASAVQACNAHGCPQDCVLSPWAEWGPCSASCNAGSQSRSRTVIVGASRGGAVCSELTASRACSDGTCPVHCTVSAYAAWSACTKSCGSGTQARSRHVVQHASSGGYACPTLQQSRACAMQQCPHDCILSDFGAWSVCSRSCGTGVQWRSRHLVVPALFGGKNCPPMFETKLCGMQSCSISCTVSEWGMWASCSATCGSGTRSRQRSIMQDVAYGGESCPTLRDEMACSLKLCPVNCQVSHFTMWSACSRSCGMGVQVRSRSVSVSASYDGQACPELSETRGCNHFECPVDCAEGPWSTWSDCSRTCGTGERSRHRNSIAPLHGGKQCGVAVERNVCNAQSCPIDCKVSLWGGWGDCTASCGGGARTRLRGVNTVEAYGGKACPLLKGTDSCGAAPCPVDCNLGAWGTWGVCSASCGGGSQKRTRGVDRPPAFGGAACSHVIVARACSTHACPVDCVVTAWGTWSGCSKSCGAGGTQQRSRTILSGHMYGGTCDDVTAAQQACSNGPCPVHCTVSSFSAWSACTVSCGTGAQSRARSVTHDANDGGSTCPALNESRSCNQASCPRDCAVSSFSGWSMCTRSCGGGSQSRARAVAVSPLSGGKACPALGESRSCSTMECPVDCTMSPFSAWGECSRTCGSGVLKRYRSVQVAAAFGGAPCPAVVFDSSSGGFFHSDSKSCNTQPCAVDCIASAWGAWGVCSQACGRGTNARSRSVLVAAKHGGVACPSLVQAGDCEVKPCPVHCKVSVLGWTLCSQSCGSGSQTQQYLIVTASQHGGEPCPSEEERLCNVHACPRDCVVSVFTAWSACGTSCGSGGTQTRHRSPSASASAGGKPCPALAEVRNCNTHACPRDCATYAFSAWTPCSMSCGGGSQTRTRMVQHGSANGGQACPVLSESAKCNDQSCPTDCVIADWGTWGVLGVDGACSVQCGGGTNSRSRAITRAPAFGGKACESTRQWRDCGTEPCPSHCEYQWLAWTACTRSCGSGTQRQAVQVLRESSHGGLACPVERMRVCNTGACAVDCSVSSWSGWGACDLSCGGGTHRRVRAIARDPRHGGVSCPQLDDFRACGTAPCPSDCAVGAFGAWSACTKSCSTGSQWRSRSVLRGAAHGGLSCPELKELRNCNAQPCAVDCQLSAWLLPTLTHVGYGGLAPLSECQGDCDDDAQCAAGFVCHQQAHTMVPGCEGTVREGMDYCARPLEPPADGSAGNGAAERGWGACSSRCGGGLRSRHRLALTLPSYGGQPCGARFEFASCNDSPCPVHCEHEWEPWSGCTKSCGSGKQTRGVAVLQMPMHGGALCPSAEERLCNTFVCPSGAPTPAPTVVRTGYPTPAPSHPGYKPVLQLVGDDVATFEATPLGFYRDQGALCIDQTVGDISSAVEVSGALFPSLRAPGVYELRYDCATDRGQAAETASRRVVVRDTTCPVCEVKGALSLTVEASFAFNDPGAACADNLDGSVPTVTTNTVDSEQVGEYFVTYRARDAAANWNDGACTGAMQYVRTVHVVDTLKPTIRLHYHSKLVAASAARDLGAGGEPNPAAVSNAAATVLMAEQQSAAAWAPRGASGALAALSATAALLALVVLRNRR